MNRAFMYGDLLFESLLVDRGNICYSDLHYHRLIKSADILGFELNTNEFTLEKFCLEIRTSIARNNFFNTNLDYCRVRYALYRDSAGFYLPHKNSCKSIIDIFPLSAEPKKKKKLGIYKSQKKCSGILSNLKTGNALIYVMAISWASKNKFDDVLILNEHGRIAEASSSNVFWQKDGVTYTPPLDEGCVDGVMRMVYMSENKVIEHICEVNDLINADRIFLSNAISGITEASL